REQITRDPQLSEGQASARVSEGLDTNEIKQWFSNRYLMKPHGDAGGWTSAMRSNLTAAESFFSILDPTVKLKGVDVKTFEIEVKTPSGVVPFEYLSSGFRSAYVLLLGI